MKLKLKFRQFLALPIGIMLIGIAILTDKLLPDTNGNDFIVGVLTGLSMVLNAYYIIVVSRKFKK